MIYSPCLRYMEGYEFERLVLIRKFLENAVEMDGSARPLYAYQKNEF